MDHGNNSVTMETLQTANENSVDDSKELRNKILDLMKVVVSLAHETKLAITQLTSFTKLIQDTVTAGCKSISGGPSSVYEGLCPPDSLNQIIYRLKLDTRDASIEKPLADIENIATWSIITVIHSKWTELLQLASRSTTVYEETRRIGTDVLIIKYIEIRKDRALLQLYESQLSAYCVRLKCILSHIHYAAETYLMQTRTDWRAIEVDNADAPSGVHSKDAKLLFQDAYEKKEYRVQDPRSIREGPSRIYNCSLKGQSAPIQEQRAKLDSLVAHLFNMDSLQSFLRTTKLGHDRIPGFPDFSSIMEYFKSDFIAPMKSTTLPVRLEKRSRVKEEEEEEDGPRKKK
jgi:hypothetical protein